MILDQFNLSGKVAIVTGSSTGLGEGMAYGLAEAGADIVGVYNNDLPENQEKIEAFIVGKTVEAFGRLDILVNNAGIIIRNKSVDFTEEQWDDVVNINLKTLFFLSQAAARQFISQKTSGKIINIASLLSFQGGILVPSYTASKSGVMGLTRLLGAEWAPHNINVNAIAPGYMATRNTQALQDEPVRNKQILERIPAGRWGRPDDMKGAVLFLASEASNYINGYTIAVDGGWLAR
jgi:2-deoxy-D-gluconate 3-dehydrogenase